MESDCRRQVKERWQARNVSSGRFTKKIIYTKKQKKKTCNGSTTISCIDGRRVVELGFLAEQLKAGCQQCKTPLMLHHMKSETKKGFGSYLNIECQACFSYTTVLTGKLHNPVNARQRKVFDVNTKAILGKFHGPMFLVLSLFYFTFCETSGYMLSLVTIYFIGPEVPNSEPNPNPNPNLK